jgi:hypothetical protein
VQGAEPPAPPEPPPHPAQAEIREYKWNEHRPIESAGEHRDTFTIALKDGSKRYPVVAWVQGSNLHYIDSDGHQQVLPVHLIDRDTTEHLNREKNLTLQLPPT